VLDDRLGVAGHEEKVLGPGGMDIQAKAAKLQVGSRSLQPRTHTMSGLSMRIKHAFMRESREKKLQELISLTNPSARSTVLDVGAADKEYSPFDNYLEKKYPYPQKITALSIYSLNEFARRYPHIRSVTYQGGVFPFEDDAFDIVFSNAVIEHITEERERFLFVKEMMRVGRQFYFTTPAKEFPVELHTNYPLIHWFPEKVFDRIVAWTGKGWAKEGYMRLLTKKDLNRLVARAQIRDYRISTHYFGPFPFHYSVWGRGEN
jgi:SAM-dependent methyltransferase